MLVTEGCTDEITSSPKLGDSLNKTITLQDERKIGLNIYKNLQKQNNVINEFLISDYITYLGNRLSRNLAIERDYIFFVTKSASVNAFAVPGGFIGLNAGLINLTQNEAQLAGVVAHELGHVVLRHSAEMMAQSNVNSIPLWIGIFAGMLAGQTEASIASIKSGIGLSVQNNINLVRENEIESDNFAVKLMQRSNYDLNEMANLFRLMQGDSNSQSNVNEYFMTHPLYKNRISTIRNRAKEQNNPILNSSNDYLYVRNIINNRLDSPIKYNYQVSEDAIENHKISLKLLSEGRYKEARNVLQESFDKSNFNIYLASTMSEIYWSEGNKNEAKNILENVLSIYPNRSIRVQLAFYNIKDKFKLEENINFIESIVKKTPYNPELYKLLAEGYTLTDNLYKSKLAQINYYDLKGNMPLAFKVIDDAMISRKLSAYQKDHLRQLKNSILCSSAPPLEPIFGNKTCN
tara:strand:+ start:69 stop:1454 length:1386 start_codon:yes stop_codon:yes gene_type:complete